MADSLEYLNSLNTRRYRCCCGRCHVRRGALLVGTIELLVATAVISALCYFFFAFYSKPDEIKPGEVEAKSKKAFTEPPTVSSSTVTVTYFAFAAGLSFGLLYIVAVALLFSGVRRSNARFLLPHLVLQILTVICLALAVILSICLLATGYFGVKKDDPERNESNRVEKGAIFVLIFASVLFVFEIWFFSVVYKCYRYLKAKEAYLRLFYGKSPFLASLAGQPPSQARSRTDGKPFEPTAHHLLPWIDAEQS